MDFRAKTKKRTRRRLGMFKKLFVDKTNHGLVQLFRYGLVVCIAFPVDFGLLYFFTAKLHIYYVVSAVLSFSISMVVNYLLSVAWVFDRRTDRALWFDTVAFAIIGFVGLGLTAFFIWLLTDMFGFQYLVSKLIAVTIVFFWSFGARRYLFQKHPGYFQ